MTVFVCPVDSNSRIDIFFFFSSQVASDPRFRLEEKLRDAGLMTSDYARVAMNRVKPLHPPRPDLNSTVFKLDE